MAAEQVGTDEQVTRPWPPDDRECFTTRRGSCAHATADCPKYRRFATGHPRRPSTIGEVRRTFAHVKGPCTHCWGKGD